MSRSGPDEGTEQEQNVTGWNGPGLGIGTGTGWSRPEWCRTWREQNMSQDGTEEHRKGLNGKGSGTEHQEWHRMEQHRISNCTDGMELG